MEKIEGQAANLMDLINYQDGSVVSKEIIRKDTEDYMQKDYT